ncbi:AEC family transporter [Kyrpidia tusciae]|uniref:Auxin Efflux Carrier n=1 Tax=Kyrpidia tusciae (strain DSM 2912 / NBRC 15312 / T2) TaxID=562970 RepID=D5WTR4_KYRT2|nr:AEC family transporter [Kyrpidia tusciae]ADG05234.1 Auxin Efflux Carrier [Kyrpidia tusciae DSM 2912]
MVVPVIFVIGIGYLFGRYASADLGSISKFSMVVLSPALIFSFLVRNQLDSHQLVKIVAAVLLFTVVMAAVTLVVMGLCGMKPFMKPALLATVFPNTGNYGLPILLFAYGQQAFSMGVVIVVVNFILMYTLGVYFASLERASWRTAITDVFRLPTTYATLAAIIVSLLHIPIPSYIYDPLKMMGDAMIPVVMLILGMQLAHVKPRGDTGPTVISSLVRLVVSPAVMLGIVYLFGIGGLMAKVLIVQNSMPTAVIMTMIAAEYRARPDFVAGTTFLSTLMSFGTITGLLYGVNRLFGS